MSQRFKTRAGSRAILTPCTIDISSGPSRFGAGLTVLEARGQWRDARSGATTREASRVVEIVHADGPQRQRDLAEVAAHYKARFRQQAVLVTQAPVRACP